MLLMLTLATLSLDLEVLGRLAGFADSVQMATCTAGQHPYTIGQTAMTVLSAATIKSASTAPWLPKLLGLQLSGTMRKMTARLTP